MAIVLTSNEVVINPEHAWRDFEQPRKASLETSVNT